MTENIEKLIAVLRKSNNKTLLPGGLEERLSKKALLSVLEIRTCLLELRKREWVRSAAWDERGFPLAKLEVLLPPEPLRPYEQNWGNALKLSNLSEEDRGILMPAAKTIRDMPFDEMLSLVKGLESLRTDQQALKGERLFDVSARYLLNSSKLLKSLPSRVLTDFGVNLDLFAGPPRYVIVAGTRNPKATVLVENPHSFEAAVIADQNQDFCWISAYGYGLSKQDESFGEQLTDSVTNRKGVITLSRRDHFVDFQAALAQANHRLFFWGDLDLAGLDIYGRLKTVLPALQLSPLYKPMIDILKQGGGHSYSGVQKERQTLGDFPFKEIEGLDVLVEVKGVDQEAIVLSKDLLYKLHDNPEAGFMEGAKQ
jgi:hypothetical protein